MNYFKPTLKQKIFGIWKWTYILFSYIVCYILYKILMLRFTTGNAVVTSALLFAIIIFLQHRYICDKKNGVGYE